MRFSRYLSVFDAITPGDRTAAEWCISVHYKILR
jgi:hypothetical protein